jgi:two-component system NtrC family sensor kinase
MPTILEYRIEHPSRGYRWICDTRSVIVDETGGSFALIGSARDITHQKEAEEALRESEQKFRTLAEESPNMIFINLKGRVVYANKRCEDIMGYEREEFYSDEFDFLNIIAPEYRKTLMHNFAQHLRGENLPPIEYSLLTRDGTRLEAILTTKLIEYDGEMAILGIVTDITDRKKAEQQLLLTSKLASVGELASGVAHELNNPLTGIMGYAELLLNRDGVPDEVRSDLKKIFQQSERTAKIVQNLLSFARRHRPEKVYIDVNEIIENTLELRDYELRVSNIRVVLDLSRSPVLVYADRNQLQQVFLNLIINAEQAIEETRSKGTIYISTAIVGEEVHVVISDNGSGIAHEYLDKIFDPFFTTKEVGRGTGLGLSICHGIILEHEGSISADSTPKKGTRFTIRFPRSSPDAPMDQGAAQQESRAENEENNLKILVVDDEPVVRDVLTRLLEEMGHRAQGVQSARDAFQLLATDEYHLCLLDLKMPIVSGERMYRQLVERDPGAAEKVVFMTGDTITASTHDFLESTGRPYLCKPIDGERLSYVIRDITDDLRRS